LDKFLHVHVEEDVIRSQLLVLIAAHRCSKNLGTFKKYVN
jgi:hypothetical protein